MAQGQAYWIKGDKVILVKQLHIKTLIKTPEIFGLSDDEIDEVYKKHGEPRGTEGDAREELCLMAMRFGWIRGREYIGRSERLSIELWSLSEYQQRVLMSFGQKYLENGVDRRIQDNYAKVTVTEFWSREGDARRIDSDKSPTGQFRMKRYQTNIKNLAAMGVFESLTRLDFVPLEVIREDDMDLDTIGRIMREHSLLDLRESRADKRTGTIRRLLG